MKRISLFTFFLFLLLPFYASAQLKFNEIMPSNVSAIMDDAYNYSMWVELYNSSTTTTFNQSNFYITDTKKMPAKWRPASASIAPGGFSIIYFERDDRTGHASFKLDPEGGKLFMYDATLVLVDSVIYPAQYRNVSYGRLTDGGATWGFFEDFSAGTSNAKKKSVTQRCGNPVFTLPGGFYSTSQSLSFATPQAGDTIIYTLNGSEPTRTNGVRFNRSYGVSISATTAVRARCISAGKMSGDIITHTYFIGLRDFKLPVVSIITTQANLTDNTIGIYCDGTNGITGNGQSTPKNYNQDWDRPANFELFDTTGVTRLNQEVDINILGCWTRANGMKSLGIEPKKKHGDNQLRYDIFAATKPGLNYKNIQMRNSGNDFAYSMMRDAFMQSIVMKRMDIDYLAYEPAVCFMNGVYWGIQNLREKANSNYVYSNYGVDDDEVSWIEATNLGVDTEKDIATDPGFATLSDFLKGNDMTDPVIYGLVNNMLDVNEFANYMMTEIYYGNYDWPYNNVKMWKKNVNGKWRWFLFDTDFGFGLYNSTLYTHNTLTFALGENSASIIGGYSTQPEWSTIVLSSLVKNPTFLNKFIDRYCIHMSTTFETNRMNHILDSLSAKISNEIVYHKNKWGSNRTLAADVAIMKNFSANRTANMLSFLSARFCNSASVQTVTLSSNAPGATYKMNGEPIIDTNVSLKYFNGRTMEMEARPVSGYKFKQWEVTFPTTTLFSTGSSWKYNDGSAIPATNWYTSGYSDAAWKSGNAPMGYGFTGVVTTLSYGTNSSSKYPTAYFRKTVSITNLAAKSNFNITIKIDDGAAVYVNGTEVGRSNLPTGTLAYSTLASTTNNGITATFAVPVSLLKEGNNVIAVEVHQGAVGSSDLQFDMSFTCTSATPLVVTTPVYTTVLTGDFALKAVYEVSTDNVETIPLVVINEVIAENSKLTDENGDLDDYIELYNNGDAEVNVAGWYLTDVPVNRTLVQIPTTDSTKTIIPSKGRLILWADDEPTQGVLHLGLKISKDGEKLILSKKNLVEHLVIVDSVTIPALAENVTYSRVPDGAAHWMLRPTTCNASNGVVDALLTPESNVMVYPTMVRETIYVNNAAGELLTITDLTGKVLLQKQVTSSQFNINAGFLQRGLYILNVGNNKAFKIVKL